MRLRRDPTPGVNDAPDANDDLGLGTKNSPVNGDLLANDTDPNGGTLTVRPTPIQPPANGTVVINPDGTYTYTPDPDFVGNDSFVYEVCDAAGACDQATVYLTISDKPPIAEDDFNNTLMDTPVEGNVLSNDYDLSVGDTIRVSEVNGFPIGGPVQLARGVLFMNADGSYRYEPNAGVTGSDTFTYTIVDEAGNETEARVDIEIRDIVSSPADAAPDRQR